MYKLTSVEGLFVGFGISINYKKLSEILEKIYPDDIVVCNSSEDSNISDSDEDWCEKVQLMESTLQKFPIQMGMRMPLDIIMYPHTHELYKKEEVAVGFFEHLTEDSGNKETEFILRNLFMQTKTPPAFKKMFGEKTKFMLFMDGCHCCS